MGSGLQRGLRRFVPAIEGLEMRLSAANTLDSLLGIAGLQAISLRLADQRTEDQSSTAVSTSTLAVSPLVGADSAQENLLTTRQHEPNATVGDPAREKATSTTPNETVWWGSPVVDVFGSGTELFDHELSRGSAPGFGLAASPREVGNDGDRNLPRSDVSSADSSMLFFRAESENAPSGTPGPLKDVNQSNELWAWMANGIRPGGGGEEGPSIQSAPPDAVDDEVTTDEDTAATLYYLTYNDTDPDGDTLEIVSFGSPANGQIVLQADQTYNYVPNLNWNGTDTFTYTVSDGQDTDTATVTVTVAAVNDPPVADNKNVPTNQNTPIIVTFTGSDVEGSPIEFFIYDDPTNGTLSDLDGNTITYVPNGNFFGTDTFTYKATDGQSASDVATVTVTVQQVSQGPGVTITQSGGSTKVAENGGFWEELASDTYTVVLNTQPTGDVVITVNPDSQVSVSPPTLTFTPLNWSVRQTVTVQAVDDVIVEADPHSGGITHSASSSDPAYNGIGIAGVTVLIVENDLAWVSLTPRVQTLVLNELGATSDTYTIELTSRPAADVTVTLQPNAQVTLSPSSLVFTPSNWNVPRTVTVQAVNDGIAEGYQEVTIRQVATSSDAMYQGVTSDLFVYILDDDAPNAVPDSGSTDEDTALTLNVIANDLDQQGYTLSVTGVTQGTNGAVTIVAPDSVRYSPTANWSGTDTFTYTIGNGQGGFDTATVKIAALPVNDPPSVTNPGNRTNAEDAQVSLQIAATDLEQTSFLYTASALPPGLVIDPRTGRIWGWIDPRAAGNYSTSVTVDDLAGGTTTVAFSWAVTNTNHAPHLRWMGGNPAYQVGEQVGINVFAEDIDGDTLTISVSGLPNGVQYDPALRMILGSPTTPGTYTVTVQATDGLGGFHDRSFLLRVTPAGSNFPRAVLLASANDQLTLAYPATPFQVFVAFYNSDDPSGLYTVTLSVTPSGNSAFSTSTFQMRHGDFRPFTITPRAPSPQAEGTIIRTFVSGVESTSLATTNVGVVLPPKVRAANTPDGMKNRVTLGTGNWGTFQGEVTVTPNLKGLYFHVGLGLEIRRPQPDDRYGSATIDPSSALGGLSVANRTVITVNGTVQTAATEEGGGNADNLWLAATVNAGSLVMAQKFAVAAIPAAMKITVATVFEGQERISGKQRIWAWGVNYKMVPVPDAANQTVAVLADVRIGEVVKVGMGSGFLKEQLDKKLKVLVGWVIASEDITDYSGIGAPAALDLNKLKKDLQQRLQAGKIGNGQTLQHFRYFNKKLENEPKKIEDGKKIVMSYFTNILKESKKDGGMTVQKKPGGGGAGEDGLADPAATAEAKVVRF